MNLPGRSILSGISLCAILIASATYADENVSTAPTSAPGTQPPSSTSETPTETKKVVKTRNQLPRYYAAVVTEAQRRKIYDIQNEYRPRIAEARERLNALLDAQKKAIEAVLTPEQKKRIDAAAGKKTEEKETEETSPDARMKSNDDEKQVKDKTEKQNAAAKKL